VYQTFGKEGTGAFYNNINPKKTLFTVLVDLLELFATWCTERWWQELGLSGHVPFSPEEPIYTVSLTERFVMAI